MKPAAFADLKAPGLFQGLFGTLLPRDLECIQVEMTSHCAGRCTYCPRTVLSDSWRSRHMAAETFAALWPLMLRARRVHLQGWGEPFLHPEFMEFARLALSAGCQVSTTSGGLRMDEGLAEDIVASGMDVVAFSLTGTDAASNAARAGVPFERVERAVRILQGVREKRQGVHLEIHLAYLLLASQLEALRGLPGLMDEWGVHAVVVSTLDCVPTPELAGEGFHPDERDKIAAAERVLAEVGVEVRASGRDIFAVLPRERPAPSCRERAHRTLYCDAEGVLAPCVLLNLPLDGLQGGRLTFGSIRDEDAASIWDKPEYQAFRRALETDSPDPACKDCLKRFEYLD
ncbi:radical SAM protein [Desulfocurvus sp. DL9XJH121]